MKKYAGVGSRKAPKEALNLMTDIAKQLEKKEFLLRSGGAIGSDQAFEKGVHKLKEIFYAHDCTEEAQSFAKVFIPHWNSLDEYAKKLHGRNSFQVMGRDLHDKVDFVVCWTEGGKLQGGTRTAIVIAKKHDIPVFNLGKEGELEKLVSFLLHNYNVALIV